LDIGGLYQPLTFLFNGWKEDFTVYFSGEERVPNEDNGYERKYEKQ